MIQPTDKIFPTNDMPHGIDLRTWMATQFMAAYISIDAYPKQDSIEAAVGAADMLIEQLNKPQP